MNYAHGPIAELMARKGELVVTCPPGREILAARLLQHFLVREGKHHLVPACRELADACGVAVSAVSVRNQISGRRAVLPNRRAAAKMLNRSADLPR